MNKENNFKDDIACFITGLVIVIVLIFVAIQVPKAFKKGKEVAYKSVAKASIQVEAISNKLDSIKTDMKKNHK